MTNFEAFCNGFWSAWDFTRPFSEKAVFRTREEMDAECVQLWEKLGLNESVWDSVGGHLYKAMETMEKEIERNDRSAQAR